MVESAFHSPAHVEERINAFLESFPRTVEDMTDEEFVKTRRSLVDSVLTMDVSLTAEADRHWTHVTNQKYQYYRGQIVASMIDKITKEQVVEWLRANVYRPRPTPGGSPSSSTARTTRWATTDRIRSDGPGGCEAAQAAVGLAPEAGRSRRSRSWRRPRDVCRLTNTDARRSSEEGGGFGFGGEGRGGWGAEEDEPVGAEDGGQVGVLRRGVPVPQARVGGSLQDAQAQEVRDLVV